jgi:hypothetical protein
MKKIISAVLLMGAVCGCQTCPDSARLQTIARDVLDEHHFAPPSFLPGRDGIIWAVAARPLSDASVQTVCLKLQRDRASVEIADCVHSPTDWAILGRLFNRGSQQEAAEIEQSVENQLKKL